MRVTVGFDIAENTALGNKCDMILRRKKLLGKIHFRLDFDNAK
jgi:hypothetical protein